ncbi:uncharacterized protein LOC125489291 [Plutella xylostella]|uniref:uncharacterized protein LOC125489291 n=1 Tax=Plutella xylostella TaxID=51655 RepID=UPI0020322931|nr:uncharacterized protein LOC125489291 [Plutella xylostella]
MDTLKQSLADLSTHFSTSMAAFQEGLQNSQVTPSTERLAADFATFRTFILTALESLQQQVTLMAQQMDRQEMHSRRKMLLLHGVKEEKDEDTSAVVVKAIGDHLKAPASFSASDISRCHRKGRSGGDKPRTIIIKFKNVACRDQIWFGKTGLKGSGMILSEFLTKPRHDAFMAARQRVGVSRCWTRNGVVVVQSPDGKQHRVATLCELDKVCPATPPATRTAAPVPASPPVTRDAKAVAASIARPKRAGTAKK